MQPYEPLRSIRKRGTLSSQGVMTSEDGIGRVRKAYLAEESGLDSRGRMQLLAAANHCDRLIWLFGEMGRTYMALSDIQESH